MAGRRHPSDIQDARLLAVLDKYVPPIIGRSIVERARREAISGPDVSWTDPNGLLDRISVGVKLFAAPDQQAAILREITDLAVAEREEPASGHGLDLDPSSSMRPASSRTRDEPPTRREPALGPLPPVPSSASAAARREPGEAAAPLRRDGDPPPPASRRDVGPSPWTSSTTSAAGSSSTPAPAAGASPWAASSPSASGSSASSTIPGPGPTGWGSGSSAGSTIPGPAPDAGTPPPRRSVAEAPPTRGVFPTSSSRSASPGLTGAGGPPRIQVVRTTTNAPTGAPPAPGRASGTPATGMPRVPATAREGTPVSPTRLPVAGGMPRAPGRVDITHAVPKAPPVPSRVDLGALPRVQQTGEPTHREVTITLSTEHDIPLARQVAREICEHLGTRALTQQRLLTIVSELGRNMVLYAGGGRMTLRPPTQKSRRIVVLAVDQGPGIPNLTEIMAGKYKSRSGLGLGLLGTKRLADSFNVETGRTGTTVSVEVIL